MFISAVRGAMAGAAATAAMSAFFFLAWRPGMGSKPPERITARLLDRVGVRRSARQQDALASATHVAFGMVAGAMFPALRAVLPRRLPPLVLGLAFGTGVWAVSYQGWVPALGLMPPASRDNPGRPRVMLAAHWIFGAVLAALAGRGPRRGAR